jgi:hypothetical protein
MGLCYWGCPVRLAATHSSLIPPGSRSERSTGLFVQPVCRGVFISSIYRPSKEGRLCRSWPNRYLGFSWVLRLHRPTHNCFSAWEPDMSYRAKHRRNLPCCDHNVLEKPVRTIAFRSNRRARLPRALGHPSIAHQSKPPNVRTKQASNKC